MCYITMNQEQVLENLSLQLTEVEMLSSMFPNEEEFQLDDPSTIPAIEDCITGGKNIEEVHCRVGFSLKLETMESKEKFELVTQFPREYPMVPPEFLLRFQKLSSSAHKLLTEHLQSFVNKDIGKGELCMCNVIEWLKDNSDIYLKMYGDKETAKSTKKNKNGDTKRDSVFSRMWIYSHHIYSKIKRKDILEFSSELNLTGFSMPGKPGIIAIEGCNRDVEEFWGRIRRMQWKRIVKKEKEDFDIGNKEINEFRKFDCFEEKYFEPRQTKHRAAHGDRGLLYKFLEEKGCAHVFQYYFGVEGKPVEHDSD